MSDRIEELLHQPPPDLPGGLPPLELGDAAARVRGRVRIGAAASSRPAAVAALVVGLLIIAVAAVLLMNSPGMRVGSGASPTASPSATRTPSVMTASVLLDTRHLDTVTISDASGLLVGARAATEAEVRTRPDGGGNPSDVSAFNPGGNPTTEVRLVWVGWICDVTERLEIAPGAASMTVFEGPWEHPGCDAVGVGRGLVLTFARPIDASAVAVKLIPTVANWDGAAGLAVGVPLGSAGFQVVTVTDQSSGIEVVRAATAADWIPAPPSSETAEVTVDNVAGLRAPTDLRLVWYGTACDRTARVVIGPDVGSITVEEGPRGPCDPAMVRRAIVFSLSRPVNPTAVKLTLVRYQVPTDAEDRLDEVQVRVDAVWDELRAEGIWVTCTGIDPAAQQVVVCVRDAAPDAEARLRALFGPLIVVRNEPSSVPPAAPTPLPSGVTQLALNSQWRLLGDTEKAGQPGVAVATTPAAYQAIWQRAFGNEQGPAIDFQREIVVAFGDLVNAGCPQDTMTGLEFDAIKRLLYGTFVAPPQASCGDVGGTHTLVVAVARSALPAGDITIRLRRDFVLCDTCGREAEEVVVTL